MHITYTRKHEPLTHTRVHSHSETVNYYLRIRDFLCTWAHVLSPRTQYNIRISMITEYINPMIILYRYTIYTRVCCGESISAENNTHAVGRCAKSRWPQHYALSQSPKTGFVKDSPTYRVKKASNSRTDFSSKTSHINVFFLPYLSVA